MAMQARDASRRTDDRKSDLRTLRRVGIWGGAATAALVVAGISAYSGTGPQRPIGPSPAVLAALSADAEEELQRLAEAVRTLSEDRDRLLTRISSLERSLDDATGSIQRAVNAATVAAAVVAREPGAPSAPADAVAAATDPSAAGAPAAGAAPSPAASEVPSVAPAPTAAATPDEPHTAAVTEAPVPIPVPAPAKSPTILPSPEPKAQLAKMLPIGAKPAPEPAPEPKRDVGIDVGSATTFDGLRALWRSATAGNAPPLEGLKPIVAVRENSKLRTPELRLIIGPLPNAKAAKELCANLSGVRRCRPVPFEGQQLALTAAAPERRPAATHRKPAAATAAKTTSPLLRDLFR